MYIKCFLFFWFGVAAAAAVVAATMMVDNIQLCVFAYMYVTDYTFQ